jgi:hypothetical protein
LALICEEGILMLETQNTFSICGIVGHKLTNYPRFGEMQTMFKDEGGSTT